MNQHERILNTIEMIRDSHPVMVDIFTEGSCINFFCILKSIYPSSELYYNNDHFVTKVGGKFYDITGQVKDKGYMPFVDYYKKEVFKARFVEMYRYYNKNITIQFNGS